MAVVAAASPVLSGDLTLFHTTDPLLANSPVLVFHGPAATIGATSSRIQFHVFTPAGVASYARLAVSPNSSFYSAVSNLPREEQGDEVCRGLAFGLKKYFEELSDGIKTAWCAHTKAPTPTALFQDDHIAILASRMRRIENVEEVVGVLSQAFGEQRQSWQDVDVVLPPGTIKELQQHSDPDASDDRTEADALQDRYGRYAELVGSLGDVIFLPTSRLKRAPSKASAIGRTASFLKQQKESARKELCELLDTEASYVSRIQELDAIATTVGTNLTPAAQQQLHEVFPDTLDSILDVNSRFLKALQLVMHATEEIALQDIEATSQVEGPAAQAYQDISPDPQGILAVAECLCEWLPQFAVSYGSYMSTHAASAQALRSIFRGADSALVIPLQEVGEQKLTSLLIEPVQRLPRYNLYIDGIAKQLPHRHPATKHLLKARDLITAICTQDDATTGPAKVTEKLRSRVSDWPTDLRIAGRLVTVTDFVELAPPYTLEVLDGRPGLLLLFTDGLILLEKTATCGTTARGLLADLDSALPPSVGQHTSSQDLYFSRRIQLDAFECVESHNGRVLQLLTHFELDKAAVPAQQPTTDSCRTLKLEATYDGKASRLFQEITKARVEGRFSESEREAHKWDVRCTDPQADLSSLVSAVFDDSNMEHVQARRGCASIRVIVDIDRHSQKPRAGQNGIRTVVAASPLRDGLWRLTVDSLDGAASRDHVAVPDIMLTLSKRLATLVSARCALVQPSMTACLLQRNLDALQMIDLQMESDTDTSGMEPAPRERVRRPKSPVKLLSSFLSSTGPGSHPVLFKKDLPTLPSPAKSRMLPPSKPPSRGSRPTSKDEPPQQPLSSRSSMDVLGGVHKKLEDTLSTYMLALQARKGNIVGRSLKMRAAADELVVNELYNSVLEDPNMMVYAAQATVDVLFAAFEKFLNIAWKEQLGQILPLIVLQEIQSKAETLFPAHFDEYFRSKLVTLSPQNQRAFKGIMKLLADLLDGTGNDGDRGMLTAAFAEVLVTEADPHEYIALIDRFVDDPDTYFGEPLEDVQKSADGSSDSHKRARSVNSSSLSSNTSSLRRKFGFSTLTRENSKPEQESKVSSILRSLSKSTRYDASPAGSMTKNTLSRSHSTDLDTRMSKRPSSQEGPTSKSNFLAVEQSRAPLISTSNLSLSTIGEHPSFIPTGPPKKKRRSSLSDLTILETALQGQPSSPPTKRRPQILSRVSDDKSLPASPMPSTPSSRGGSGRFGSPVRETLRPRLPSSFRTENSPSPAKVLSYGINERRPTSSHQKPDDVVVISRPTSGIPTLTLKPSSPPKAVSPILARAGLSERPGAGNIVKLPSSPPDKTTVKPAPASGSPKKLRMQSPQKLRERLQNEQAAMAVAQTSLQDELSKIGDELTATPLRLNSIRGPKVPNSSSSSSGNSIPRPSSCSSQTTDLAQRVLKLQAQLPERFDALHAQLCALRADSLTSLTVSETKCKHLDELYREANGENEALYARFNDELTKVVKVVRAGDGVEELKRRLKESQDEAAGLRRETQRLKRENVGLRAQLRE